MKSVKIFVALFLLAGVMSGCYSEDNPLDNMWEKTGRHFPNISDIDIISNQETYSEGDQVVFDMRFWSEDPVSEINLYHAYGQQEQELALTEPYSSAGFSTTTETDSLIIEYVIPDGSSGTTIEFEFEVVNENGLTASNKTATNSTIRNITVDVE